MAKRIRSLLFDLDGTLLDTSGDLIASSNAAVTESGLTPLPADEIKPFISGGAAAMLNKAFEAPFNQHQVVDREQVLRRMLELYEADIAAHTRLYEGMEEVIELLRSRGLAWGIVTNKAERFTHPLLRAISLEYAPSCVICGDTLPEKKPHPLPMLEACRQINCAPAEAAYIGDARRDIEAGRNAGMTTLAASYGYVHTDDPPHTWGADAIIAHPGQLVDWLNGRLD